MELEIVGDSAEAVAYRLTQDIRDIEGRYKEVGASYDRSEYLDLYAECLAAVRGDRKVKASYGK